MLKKRTRLSSDKNEDEHSKAEEEEDDEEEQAEVEEEREEEASNSNSSPPETKRKLTPSGEFVSRMVSGNNLKEAELGLNDIKPSDLLSILHWLGLELTEKETLHNKLIAYDKVEECIRNQIEKLFSENRNFLYVDVDSIPGIVLKMTCDNAIKLHMTANQLSAQSDKPISTKLIVKSSD